MFLQASVILSTVGGGSAPVHAGIPPPPPPLPGADTPQDPPRSSHPLEQTPRSRYPPTRSRPPRTRHPPEQTPTPPDQTPPWEQTPPPPGKQTPGYGQRAAGTHPTGMHSCCTNVCFASDKKNVTISKPSNTILPLGDNLLLSIPIWHDYWRFPDIALFQTRDCFLFQFKFPILNCIAGLYKEAQTFFF